MGVSRVPMKSAARGKDGSFSGDYSVDFRLTGDEHTFPSLLLWKSQLEKLKADVDQALSRVCEGLILVGPGFKSKRYGRKKKNKNKRRVRWVLKAPKPISFDLLAESVMLPEVVSSPALDYGVSENPPAVFEPSGGPCPMALTSGHSAPENQSSRPVQGPWPDYLAAAMEDGVGPSQSDFRSENVEGGVGDEVEGLGPLSVMPLAVEMDKDSCSNVSPSWVMERVKGYYKLVGVSCDQFEDKLLALFEQIEAKQVQSLADSLALVTTVSGVKGQREIKRLNCSINYDKKGGLSYRRRGKGSGVSCVNEA